jgi:hypothetical protein
MIDRWAAGQEIGVTGAASRRGPAGLPQVRHRDARTMRLGKPTSERGAAQPLAATNAGEWLRRRATGGFRGGAQALRGGA